jgi:hypothetical protein
MSPKVFIKRIRLINNTVTVGNKSEIIPFNKYKIETKTLIFETTNAK